MTTAIEVARAGAAFAEEAWGETFAFRGIDFATVSDQSIRGEVLEVGGRMVTLALALESRKSLFANYVAPGIGDTVRFDGQDYKVIDVATDVVSYRFTCESVNR